jgi:hypothetical protein
MENLMGRGGEKTKPVKANRRPMAGNPKQDEWMTNDRARFEKTKPISSGPSGRKLFCERSLW